MEIHIILDHSLILASKGDNHSSLQIYKLKINIVGPLRNLNTEDHDCSMSDTLCLRGLGLASAEAMREISPPELITGQETIELSSRFVFIACMPLLPLIATDSPRTPHHLLNIDPTKASERINFLYGKLRLIWNCFESSELIHIFGFDLLGNSA